MNYLKEYDDQCDLCGDQDETNPCFARIFYRKINNQWMKLCSKCWNIKQKQDGYVGHNDD